MERITLTVKSTGKLDLILKSDSMKKIINNLIEIYCYGDFVERGRQDTIKPE